MYDPYKNSKNFYQVTIKILEAAYLLLVAVHAQKKMFMVSCAWAKTEDAGPALHFFMYWAAARPGLALSLIHI